MATQPTLSERIHVLGIAPLVKSSNPIFIDWYTFGIGNALFGERRGNSPADDAFLLTTFQQCRKLCYFERGYEDALSRTLGLALGAIHGGALLPDGTVCSDRITLVTLTHRDTLRGYHAGREFFFTDADTEEEWHMSETRLVAWLRDLAEVDTNTEETLGTVRFHLGCILGELSGHLFTWTPEEQHTCDAESIRLLGYVSMLKPTCYAARQQFSLQAIS